MLVRMVAAVWTSPMPERDASSSRAVRSTSTRSFGRMKPPAVFEPRASIEIATARLPEGRIADRKPLPLALISFSRRIGSPDRNGLRTIDPTVSSSAVGAEARWRDESLAAVFGQDCQRRSAGLIVCPIGSSAAATSTSAISIAGGGGATAMTGGGGGGSRPLIMTKAPAPVTTATLMRSKRDDFMRRQRVIGQGTARRRPLPALQQAFLKLRLTALRVNGASRLPGSSRPGSRRRARRPPPGSRSLAPVNGKGNVNGRGNVKGKGNESRAGCRCDWPTDRCAMPNHGPGRGLIGSLKASPRRHRNFRRPDRTPPTVSAVQGEAPERGGGAGHQGGGRQSDAVGQADRPVVQVQREGPCRREAGRGWRRSARMARARRPPIMEAFTT